MLGGLRCRVRRRACEATPLGCRAATVRSVWGCRASPRRSPYHSRSGPLVSRKIVSYKRLLLSLFLSSAQRGRFVIPRPGWSLPAGGLTWRGAYQDDNRSSEPPAGRSVKANPIGSVDPYALKIQARKGGVLLQDIYATVSTHRHRPFAVWLRLARQNGSLSRLGEGLAAANAMQYSFFVRS